jgi:hypothetical protein
MPINSATTLLPMIVHAINYLRTFVSRAFLNGRATAEVGHGGLTLFVAEFLFKRSLS